MSHIEHPSKILAIEDTKLSEWVTIRAVRIQNGAAPPAVFHGLTQSDYTITIPMRADGAVALVRQWRPLIDLETWELPGGLCDSGEAIEASAVRELQEETGLSVRTIRALPPMYPDPGRLTNRLHGFFALVEGELAPEPGIEAAWFTGPDLLRTLLFGECAPAAHLAVLFAAAMEPGVMADLRGLGLAAAPWTSFDVSGRRQTT